MPIVNSLFCKCVIRLLPASCSFCFAAMAPLAAAVYAINCYTSLLAASACLSLVACASKRSLVWLRSARVWRASVPRRSRRRRCVFPRKRRLIHVALLWLCLTPAVPWLGHASVASRVAALRARHGSLANVALTPWWLRAGRFRTGRCSYR